MDKVLGSAVASVKAPVGRVEKPSQIPDWNELLTSSLALAGDPSFVEEVMAYRSRPKPTLLKLGKAFTYLTLWDPTYRKFIHSSWEEIVDIIATQVAENSHIHQTFSNEDETLRPVSSTLAESCKRKYQQQPCTRHTALKRVNYAQSLLRAEDPILLLGDDDLVGIELARNGFRNVYVVDIDKGIIDRISRMAQAENLQMNLFNQDIRKDPPNELLNIDYKLVFLDPSYSVEGVEMFMKAAIHMTEKSASPSYFLSLHLMSLMQKGLKQLGDLMEQLGVKLLEFHRSFNLYPVPMKTRSLMAIVNSTIANSKAMRREGLLDYFTSDAMLLVRKTTQVDQHKN